MINLSKSGDTIVFEFINNGHYLENGTIEVPVNSLSLVIDSSNMATFKKASSNDVFIAATYDELGMTKAELETFYKENMAGSTGGGGGATYSAGLGIEIDSADTITAIYEGYPYVDEDDEHRQFTDVTDQFYIKHDDDGCQGSNGVASFYCDNSQFTINFDFINHDISYDTEDWRAYFSITWDDEVKMFLVTPLQTISTVNDEMCTRFVWPTDIILTGSGKTTSVITDVLKKANASVNDLWFSLVRNNLGIYYSKNGINGAQGTTVNIGGGLYGNQSNSTLTTRVKKSLDKTWVDYPGSWGSIWYIEFDNVEAVSFDLTATPTVEISVSTTNYGWETIVNGDGSIASGQSGVSVTEDNGHIVVTAIDGLITNLGAMTAMSNYMANLKQYGYEYTTIDSAVETILSGKQDTLSAGTGIEISGNVISATGGGATYSAGLGIEIDSADTITAIYEGYPQVDDEAKTIRLSNTTDPFYVMGTSTTSTSGATRFKFGSKNRNAIYDFAQHTATIDGEEWPDYLTWQWSDSYNMFLITPLQSIPSATANTSSSGTTFVMPSGVTLVNSGKTSSVITDLTTKADNAIVDIAVGIDNQGFTYGYYKPGDTLPTWAAMVGIKGGLTNDNGALTTKVLKSLGEHWYDIDLSTILGYHINLEPATSVQFDYNNNPSYYSVWIYTNVFGEEQIIDDYGSVITGLSGVTVTKEDSHVVVTAIDNPYAETPYRITGLDTNSTLSEIISNLRAYGYEYTTIDNAVETILSGKQDTLSAGTGIEISGNVISATGGGGGTVSSAITSGDTNAVAGGAVYDKFDEVEQVTAAALNNLSAAFDGLKLKKLTQAQYDALSPNYDNNTLYVII